VTTTVSCHPRPSIRGSLTLCACLCAAAVTTAVAAAEAPALVADAAVPWHPSLAAASRAAAVSRRPVLAIVTSGGHESTGVLAAQVFPAPETVALLTACFEPVRIDVDVDPSTAGGLGVSRVPTACIIDGQGRVVACFDCPTTPAAFVAAATRAAQDAATAGAAAARSADVLVRETDPAGPAATPGQTATPAEPALAPNPPEWPAEPAARPMPTPPAATAARERPMLEPASAVAPAAPWLAAAPSASATPTAPAAQPAPRAPAAATSVTPSPVAGPGEPPAPAQPEKKSAADAWLAAFKNPFGMFARPKADDAAPAATEPVAGTTVEPDPVGSLPLGLEGYCPVTLVDKGTWVEGRAQWGARHRGRTYLFAGADQQRTFLADPDRYAPALSGDDPVLACDTGRQVAGQRRYGVTYQARTYLFSSPETRAAFAANPQRYTMRVTLAERPTTPGTVVR